MNAYAIKPKVPYIAKNKLTRTPITENNRKMIEYIDSHDFSFSVDGKQKEARVLATDK